MINAGITYSSFFTTVFMEKIMLILCGMYTLFMFIIFLLIMLSDFNVEKF